MGVDKLKETGFEFSHISSSSKINYYEPLLWPLIILDLAVMLDTYTLKAKPEEEMSAPLNMHRSCEEEQHQHCIMLFSP